MTDTSPATRASVRAGHDVDAGEFLPLAWRRVIYLLGLAALVVAPSVAVQLPEYGEAITTAGNLLGAAGLGTALANPSR